MSYSLYLQKLGAERMSVCTLYVVFSFQKSYCYANL